MNIEFFRNNDSESFIFQWQMPVLPLQNKALQNLLSSR